MGDWPKLSRGDTLVLATHNAGKLAEFRDLLKDFGLAITSAGELGLPEPEETGTTFVENARLKAHAAAKATGQIALSDDSGISVDALEGAPGVYTADWAGIPRDFGRAMQKVEDELQKRGATAPSERRAAFNATFCLAHPDGRDVIFTGVAPGTLVWPPRGENGHGYDPMFLPDGQTRTFGEMSAEEKHSWAPGKPGLSHRARAFAKFVEDIL
ncbi:RdgB/HAM1 family non-canonical purine NTP pyrophosphatase [Pelagibacterium xiamenense]|uniref:RdgB/HAM1 family non-canonical purine NTP pyrophosphatase n=1 Tax=Pelagibacterium xiamenense TaxID=2901140 RepID=UPI001E2D3E19|nr:RdgB/HAM1 family non-canonical purine NTP pyrophosphatase [Pelagibacterium xiamenense]MCD7058464.1 RdgB/HAM1 family non-canonical purine NTP pyrophosphatase [Pelagibacterium xiamenense]